MGSRAITLAAIAALAAASDLTAPPSQQLNASSRPSALRRAALVVDGDEKDAETNVLPNSPMYDLWKDACKAGGNLDDCEYYLSLKAGSMCFYGAGNKSWSTSHKYKLGSGGGAYGLIRSIEGSGTVSLQDLLKEEIEDEDFLTEWAWGQIQWMCYAGFWLLLAIAGLFWSFALCSSNYRNCCSKGCGGCKRKCCLPCCGIFSEIDHCSPAVIAGVVILFCYCLPWVVLSGIQSAYAVLGSSNLGCVAFDAGESILFGNHFVGGSKNWHVIVNSLADPVLEPAWETDANYLVGGGQQAIVDNVNYFTVFGAHLAETQVNLGGDSAFLPWDLSGVSLLSPYGSACYGCDAYANEPNPPDLGAIAVSFQNHSTAFATALDDVRTITFPPLLDSIASVSDFVKLEEENQFVLDTLETLDAPDIYSTMSYTFHVLWIFPAIVMILLILYVPLLFLLPDHKNIKMNGAMCFLFGFFGLILFIGGIAILVIAQMPAEACKFVRVDLFRDGKYWEYPGWARNVDDDYRQIVDYCYTGTVTHPYGQDPLWGLLERQYPEVRDYDRTAIDVSYHVGTFSSNLRRLVNETQTDELSSLNDVLSESDAVSNLIYTSPAQADQNNQNYDPRIYAMFRSSLFATLHDEEIPLNVSSRFENLANDLQQAAFSGIRATSFKLDQNTPAFSSQPLESLLARPESFGTMEAELEELNELTESDCGITVCRGGGCCGNNADCVPIDGFHLINIQPTATKNEFWLMETLSDSLNRGLLENLFKCFRDRILFNPSDAYLFVAAVNSLNAMSKRVRLSDAPSVFTMYNSDRNPNPGQNTRPYSEWKAAADSAWQALYELADVSKIPSDAQVRAAVRASEMNQSYGSMWQQVACLYGSNTIQQAQDYTCQGVVGNLAMSGVWWLCLSAGCLGLTIFCWVRYGYYQFALEHQGKADFDDDTADHNLTPVIQNSIISVLVEYNGDELLTARNDIDETNVDDETKVAVAAGDVVEGGGAHDDGGVAVKEASSAPLNDENGGDS